MYPGLTWYFWRFQLNWEEEQKKEEETEPDPEPEPKENGESESKSCDCTHKKEESVEKEVKKEPELVEVIDSRKEDTHSKKNPIKSIIETKKIIRENHISSRFYWRKEMMVKSRWLLRI